MSGNGQELRLTGRAVSGGVVVARAFLYRDVLEVPVAASGLEEDGVEAGIRRIEKATRTVAEDLRVSARRIQSETDAKLAAIFEAHEVLLRDPGLRREIRDLMEQEVISAARALARVFRRREHRLREMKGEAPRRFADDVADLGQRLLREMAGITTTGLEKMPAGHVLVARRLLPSDTVALPRGAIAGIVVEFGGPGSHAALLAEALGIPTVGQIPGVMEKIADGDLLVVDGFRGEVVLHPAAPTLGDYAQETARRQARVGQVMEWVHQPVRTRDGTQVSVLANVGSREDILASVKNGADGVGLYRLEQFYLSRKTPPNTDELLAELREAFAPAKGKPITVRLLDLGGDKPVPFLRLPPEENPLLGLRGVRLLLHYPHLFETQCKALLRFAQEHDVRILVPMVTLPEDMARVRSQLADVAKGLTEEKLPPLGAMIETPAAALCVREIAAQADFLSLGTNDLTQYTMAAGRENPLVDDYYRDDHPAVLRLVSIVVEEARALPLIVCGELARKLEMIPTLLKLGVRSLSVAPPLVPAVKEAVRETAL